MDGNDRKATDGDINIPIVRIETSQKATKGVHLNDLANRSMTATKLASVLDAATDRRGMTQQAFAIVWQAIKRIAIVPLGTRSRGAER